jgi:putative endonuclease
VFGTHRKEEAVTNDTRAGLERVARGRTGEQAAATFLADRGYRVVAKNQRTPLGELDLICRCPTHVVVVEVKARSGGQFGDGLEAIGPRKARRLRAAAMWWLSEAGWLPCPLRFDAVVVSLDSSGLPCILEHFKDVLS